MQSTQVVGVTATWSPSISSSADEAGGAVCTAIRIELAMPSSQPRLITIVTARWRSDARDDLRVRTEHDGYGLAGDERRVGDELVQDGFTAQAHELLDVAEARAGPSGEDRCMQPQVTVFHGR